MKDIDKTQVYKDYTTKIMAKLYNEENSKEKAEDVNSLVVFLNYCFMMKNNFFIPEFNKKLVSNVCISYNQLKTNILSPDSFYGIGQVFNNVTHENLKTIRFILYKFANQHDELSNNEDTKELCQKVAKKSIKNCIGYITSSLS